MEIITFDTIECYVCQIKKLRHKTEYRNNSGGVIYFDEHGQKWQGRRCPLCFKIKGQQEYLKKKVIKINNINCLECNIEIKAKNNLQRYCSKKCRNRFKHKKNYKPKPRKLKIPKIKPIVIKNCEVCNNEFQCKSKRNSFCSRKCFLKKYRTTPQYKAYKKSAPQRKIAKEIKRLNKRKRRKAKLKSVSWSQIGTFYSQCPEGYQVDHIIPLNNPIVSGLHVPWNMQYLTPIENRVKSNDFDGTPQNLTWKNKLKNHA